MTKLLVSAIAAAGLLVAPASAGTIYFKGAGGLNVTPDSFVQDCGTVNVDFCTPSDDPAAGLTYTNVEGVTFTVFGFQDGGAVNSDDRDFATVIQDIRPNNSGLGVYSDGESRTGPQDQVQSRAGESLMFDFTATGPNDVIISNIEFNSGADRDCQPNPGKEGPCGLFDLYIDGVLEIANTDLEAVNLLETSFVGKIFEFVAKVDDFDNSGFVIARFDVQEVPIPGALPLLLSGIAGLGFAARRKKAA